MKSFTSKKIFLPAPLKRIRYNDLTMKTLADLGELRTGFQLREAARHRQGGANHLIQLGDVRDEGIEVSELMRMDLTRARERDCVSSGDIVLRSRGSSYRAAVLPECPPGTVAIAPLYVLRLREAGLLPTYLMWFINQPASQAVLATNARGTHIPTVSREAFAKLEVIVPPLADQQRIVEIDTLLRGERELSLRLLEKREQLVQAVLGEMLDRFQS